MGLLGKLTADPPPSSVVPEPTPAVAARPSVPCPAGHAWPAGTTWWLDPYGCWNCLDCHPPAAEAFVRDWIYVGGDGDGGGAGHEPLDDGLFRVAPGFEITAISRPGGGWLFNPATTRAQRREAVECVEWFDRSDARERKKQKPKTERVL